MQHQDVSHEEDEEEKPYYTKPVTTFATTSSVANEQSVPKFFT